MSTGCAMPAMAENEPTKKDKIDNAPRSRAYLLAKALHTAGAKPGDEISEEAWGLAEACAGITVTSPTTRAYSLELLDCLVRGVEPLLVAGRHYDLPPAYHDYALWVDRTLRQYLADRPHLDVEQAAVIHFIQIAKMAQASTATNPKPASETAPPPAPDPLTSEIASDVLSALLNMKVKASVATTAVKRAVAEVGAVNFDQLFSLAIRYVSPVKEKVHI